MSEMLLPMLVVGTFVGGAAGYVGSLMVSYRMALVGDALGHVALPGIGLALLWQLDASLGALAALLIGILLIWRLRETTLLPFDTLVGIVFVTSLALGFLIVPEPELLESLIGDIASITWLGAGIAAIACVVVFAVLGRIHSGMMLLNISEELAIVQGISPARYNLIYLLAIAGLVALGVKIVGTLLVGALVIVPAASARLVARNLRQYVRVSIVLGSATCVGGTGLFALTGFPAGPSIILINAAVFVAALLAQRLTNTGAGALSPE
jgi:zinc transport system permease protein